MTRTEEAAARLSSCLWGRGCRGRNVRGATAGVALEGKGAPSMGLASAATSRPALPAHMRPSSLSPSLLPCRRLLRQEQHHLRDREDPRWVPEKEPISSIGSNNRTCIKAQERHHLRGWEDPGCVLSATNWGFCVWKKSRERVVGGAARQIGTLSSLTVIDSAAHPPPLRGAPPLSPPLLPQWTTATRPWNGWLKTMCTTVSL